MTSERGNLEALIAGIAAGKTVREAAPLAGMSESTAHRRLEDAEVQQRIRACRDEMFSRAAGALADALTAAVATLVASLEAENESVKVRAAQAILDYSMKWREAEDLAVRVAELEAALAVRGVTRAA